MERQTETGSWADKKLNKQAEGGAQTDRQQAREENRKILAARENERKTV